MDENDKFWGEEPNVLWTKGRLSEIFPKPEMTLPERVNAISRFVIYIGIVICFYQQESTALQYSAFILMLIFLLWQKKTIQTSEVTNKEFEIFSDPLASAAISKLPKVNNYDGKNINCTEPTPNNPFMNFLPFDDPYKKPACVDTGSKERAENLLRAQLYLNIDDLYEKNANERMFYSNPVTTSIPDREKYANWLFNGGKDCKTDKDCSGKIFEDIRLDRKQPIELINGFTF